ADLVRERETAPGALVQSFHITKPRRAAFVKMTGDGLENKLIPGPCPPPRAGPRTANRSAGQLAQRMSRKHGRRPCFGTKVTVGVADRDGPGRSLHDSVPLDGSLRFLRRNF